MQHKSATNKCNSKMQQKHATEQCSTIFVIDLDRIASVVLHIERCEIGERSGGFPPQVDGWYQDMESRVSV